LFLYQFKDSQSVSHSVANSQVKANPSSSFSTGDVLRDVALSTVDTRHGGLLSTVELEKK
jgi:hypothetical protein